MHPSTDSVGDLRLRGRELIIRWRTDGIPIESILQSRLARVVMHILSRSASNVYKTRAQSTLSLTPQPPRVPQAWVSSSSSTYHQNCASQVCEPGYKTYVKDVCLLCSSIFSLPPRPPAKRMLLLCSRVRSMPLPTVRLREPAHNLSPSEE